MSAELYELAKEGDVDALCEAVAEAAKDDDEEVDERVFQWLQVAATFGHEEADEMADDLYEASLSRGGDETVAVLHYEVAEWFIRGDNGVECNYEFGLYQLERAEELELRESVEIETDLLALRDELPDEHVDRFDEIFPGMVD